MSCDTYKAHPPKQCGAMICRRALLTTTTSNSCSLRRHVVVVGTFGGSLQLQQQQAALLLQQQQQQRSFCAAKPKKKKAKSGNVRGSRGHGWLHHYRNGGGGRHLQGNYADGRRPPLEELQAWNQQILNLGKVTVYFDVSVATDQATTEAAAETTADNAKRDDIKSKISLEEVDVVAQGGGGGGGEEEHQPLVEGSSSEQVVVESQDLLSASDTASQSDSTPSPLSPPVELHRLFIDVATAAMPVTSRNFLELCQQSTFGYANTVFHRLDKRVGLFGGDVVSTIISRTGTSGRCASTFLEPTTNTGNHSTISGNLLFTTDRHIMAHTAGTISMLCPKVKAIDSRFIFITQPDAPHLDGYHLAFGQLHPESLALVQSWVKTIFTKQGHPLTELRIEKCGILSEQENEENENQENIIDTTNPNATGNLVEQVQG